MRSRLSWQIEDSLDQFLSFQHFDMALTGAAGKILFRATQRGV